MSRVSPEIWLSEEDLGRAAWLFTVLLDILRGWDPLRA